MLGMGKKRPSGSDEASERALFRELGAQGQNTGPKPRRRLVILTLLAVTAAVASVGIYTTVAGAIDTSVVFQLDGNTADTVAVPRTIGTRSPPVAALRSRSRASSRTEPARAIPATAPASRRTHTTFRIGPG